jgi:hypothetical protein
MSRAVVIALSVAVERDQCPVVPMGSFAASLVEVSMVRCPPDCYLLGFTV